MRAFGNETFILVFLFSSLRVLEGLEVEFKINYLEQSNANWDKEQQSKAQNSDNKYSQMAYLEMALTDFDT